MTGLQVRAHLSLTTVTGKRRAGGAHMGDSVSYLGDLCATYLSLRSSTACYRRRIFPACLPSRPDAEEGPGPVPEAQVVFEGPEIRTIEHNGAKGAARRWFTVTRHVDPAGLIAHTLIAVDWLREIERTRKLETPAEMPLRTGPLPGTLSMATSHLWGHLRLPLGTLPLRGPARDATLRRLGLLYESAEEPEW